MNPINIVLLKGGSKSKSYISNKYPVYHVGIHGSEDMLVERCSGVFGMIEFPSNISFYCNNFAVVRCTVLRKS